MESDRHPADEGWVFAPAPPDTSTYTGLGTITVDGETFAVRRRDEDGTILYDWVSGPNNGYGFNALGRREPPTHQQHVAAIRDFLSSIDPATGYFHDP
ncbi:hypothetical protein MUK71_13560 [Arthrobacter zhangbolii]|uniref:Uncharacterized protein n=1 Tax=Arthrobacter zhangbolii TaxID=2886936 RepID=A0A9X1S9Q6_9MICC|nr:MULTISPECIES: hypothetical protein [Arthrobacter]MCC3272547.1 hypothetical protein [Arthrobacter zhangbolii]MDN3903612.1 hypothetical protein [Arthrobacter sp. YD2]UON91602.1 hypothetical protein MUK71_13560 [Arthrobacter zhangbolii]